MKQITGFVLAVYNFFVGDPIILVGIALTFVIVGLLARSAPMISGAVLVVGVLASLGLALWRETQPKKS